jgi:Ca2+-transporting ATPase
MQGLVIFGASFGTYYKFLNQSPDNAPIARAMGLTIILLANVLLVQVNSSDSDYAIKSFIRLINDKVMWVINLGTIAGLLIVLYTPLSGFLRLAPLSVAQMLLAAGIGSAAVLWYEIVKFFKVGFLVKEEK